MSTPTPIERVVATRWRWLVSGALMACFTTLPAGCSKTTEAPVDGMATPPGSQTKESILAELPQELRASLPADTVFLIEDRPITSTEIDAWLETFGWVEPTKSKHALRRLVVTNYCMPVAVAQALDPEGRALALQRMERVRTKIAEGRGLSLEDPQVERIHANYKSKLGLDRTGIAKNTPMGEWSPVFETLGGFTMVRLIGAPDPWLPNREATIEHITVSYLPPEQSKEIVQENLKHVQIRVIDPEWKRYIPTIYLHQTRLPQ